MSLFDAPVLESVEHKVGGRALTLYEFTADLYVKHILTANALRYFYEGQDSPEPQPDDEINYQDVLKARQDDVGSKILWCACSLAPGVEETVESLCADLKTNLKMADIEAMFEKVKVLNSVTDPKEGTPEESSSTD